MPTGHARVCAATQDQEAQHKTLLALGVSPGAFYVVHSMNGHNRDQVGLSNALVARHNGDRFKITKRDCIPRSAPGARVIADEPLRKDAPLNIWGD